MSLRDSVEGSLVCTFYLNLTRNLLTRGISHKSGMTVLAESADADAFFVQISECFFVCADQRAYAEQFNRQRLLQAFSEGQTLLSYEGRCRTAPDTVLWLEIVAAMAENPTTGDVECVVYARDIDERKKTNFMIERLLERDYEYLCRVDASGHVTNYGNVDNPGFDYDTLLPLTVGKYVAHEHADEALRALSRPHVLRALKTQRMYTRVFCSTPDENDLREYRSWTFAYLDDQQQDFLMSRANVTPLFVGEWDTLSGLYNKQSFFRRVRTVLDENPEVRFVMVRCDIDRFKAYNETFGFPAGDQLLADLGRQLLDIRPPRGLAGHIEADHFALLVPAAELDIAGWHGSLSSWLSRYSAQFHLTCSVGIYEVSDPKLDVSLICDRAMLALHTIKHSYVNKIAWYSDSLRQQLMDEQKLIDDMADALDNGQFLLYFQPQINYDDGTLVGAEALVRWQHPTRGLITPGHFIPLFEKNGFIARLDEYVWAQACIAMRRWRNQQDKLLPVSVSVNVSRFDIYQPDLGDRLSALVRRYDLPPSALKLEITESAYMDNPRQLLQFVRCMQERGFTVEMDDFGAGYSSINTLKNVPVDVLKLNVEFLADSDGDERGGNILSSVIRMAHWLKLPVIAEGVETRVQADYLKSLGCFFMQGYYFDRPMPAAEFELLLCQARVGDITRYRSVDLTGMAAFWDPSTQMALLFNSIVGGAAILEYAGGNMELVRINDSFFTEIGVSRMELASLGARAFDCIASADRPRFTGMLQAAMNGGNEAACEVRWQTRLPGRAAVDLHCRMRLLARNLDRYLFYLTIENITERRRTEEELRISRDALQLAVTSMGRQVLHYDIGADALTLPEEYAGKHGLSARLCSASDFGHLVCVAESCRADLDGFWDLIRSGAATASVTLRILDADGGCAQERLGAVTVFSADRVPLRAVIIVADVATTQT